MIGYRVYSPDYLGYLGQITDLLIDRCDGRLAFVVLSDTPGFGSVYAIVPFAALDRQSEHTFVVMFRGNDAPVAGSNTALGWSKGDQYAKYME